MAASCHCFKLRRPERPATAGVTSASPTNLTLSLPLHSSPFTVSIGAIAGNGWRLLKGWSLKGISKAVDYVIGPFEEVRRVRSAVIVNSAPLPVGSSCHVPP